MISLPSKSVLLVVMSGGYVSAVHGGPPMINEDTGTIDAGGFEIILGYEADRRGAGDAYAIPTFEVGYGLNDRSDITFGLTRVEIDLPGVSRKSDIGYFGVDYKYRFFEHERFSAAIQPGYALPVKSSSTDRGLIEDLRIFELPLVGGWEHDRWAVFGQLAYELTSSGPNAVSYGTMLQYQLTSDLVLMGEIWGLKVVGESESETQWNVGIDYSLTERLALLASYGGNIRSDLDSLDRLDEAFFIGVRYEIPRD